MCQAEANASLVHSVAPFGNRHITQLSGAFELLRPNVKDILYTLEVRVGCTLCDVCDVWRILSDV